MFVFRQLVRSRFRPSVSNSWRHRGDSFDLRAFRQFTRRMRKPNGVEVSLAHLLRRCHGLSRSIPLECHWADPILVLGQQ